MDYSTLINEAGGEHKQELSFKPTYLYIKQHAVTGKCYFGKTTNPDPFKNRAGNFSAETRAKLSAIMQQRTMSPEARAKISIALKGKPLSLEHRAKLSAARKRTKENYGI